MLRAPPARRPGERIDRIFEPPTAWPRSSRALPEGLKSYGLGLFIAREIVRGHAGTIVAESSRETGTTFGILLPRRRPYPWRSPGERSPERPSGRTRRDR
jgi:signal transduction histidine kinase